MADFSGIDIEKKSNEFTVHNCAMGGHSTAHSLIALCLKILDYKPDLIISHLMINDAIAASLPDFQTDYSHRYKAWSFEYQGAAATLLDFEILLLRHSYLAYFLSYAIPRYRKIYQIQGELPRAYHFYERMPGTVHPVFEVADLEKGRFAFLRNLDNMSAIIKKHGARLLLSTVPIRKDIIPYPFSQYNDFIRQFCQGRGDVFFCNVDAYFDSIQNRNEYFRDEIHVTDIGDRKKAERIAEVILEKIFPIW